MTVQRSGYSAGYFVKKRYIFGALYRDLNDGERQQLQANRGAYVGFVVDNSPAYNSTAGTGESAEIHVQGVRLVDYYDQTELPLPQKAGLQALIGQQAAQHAPSAAVPHGVPGRPHRLLLRVEFLSPADLWGIARKGSVVFLHAFFCTRQSDFAVLAGPTIYARGEPVRAQKDSQTQEQPEGSPYAYYFFMNAARQESAASKPREIGFDLGSDPQDVCFYVTGSDDRGLNYKSDVAAVTKQAIANAFREAKARDEASADK